MIQYKTGDDFVRLKDSPYWIVCENCRRWFDIRTLPAKARNVAFPVCCGE